jgi:hypothetical protein
MRAGFDPNSQRASASVRRLTPGIFSATRIRRSIAPGNPKVTANLLRGSLLGHKQQAHKLATRKSSQERSMSAGDPQWLSSDRRADERSCRIGL